MLGTGRETVTFGNFFSCVGYAYSQELPTDPREWSRGQVAQWLKDSALKYELNNTHPERFPMNGKGLVLLTREMFLYRVPEGGGLLFEDIQLRMRKAISEALGAVAREAMKCSVGVGEDK